MFYSGVNPKMTDALKQWKKAKKKKGDPPNKTSYFLVFKYNYT